MSGVLVEVPDVIELAVSIAHVSAHEGKTRSLDADVAGADINVAVGAVVAAVMGGALDTEVVAEVVLTGDAGVACVGDVIDDVGLHGVYPFPLS